MTTAGAPLTHTALSTARDRQQEGGEGLHPPPLDWANTDPDPDRSAVGLGIGLQGSQRTVASGETTC